MKDYIEQDRLEAEKYADRFIEHVNDDHTDVISFPREVGCRIRDHIETLRRLAAPPAIGGEAPKRPTLVEGYAATYYGDAAEAYMDYLEAALAKAPQAAVSNPANNGWKVLAQEWEEFAGKWRKVVVTTCTLLGISPALSAQESMDAIAAKLQATPADTPEAKGEICGRQHPKEVEIACQLEWGHAGLHIGNRLASWGAEMACPQWYDAAPESLGSKKEVEG